MWERVVQQQGIQCIQHCTVYINAAICIHATSYYSYVAVHVHVFIIMHYCILRGRIKGFNRSITTIMCEVGSYRTVVG